MLRRLAALPAREEALELAAEPGLELVFFPRALLVGETPRNEWEIIRMVPDIWGNFPNVICPNLRGCSCFGRSLPHVRNLEWISSCFSNSSPFRPVVLLVYPVYIRAGEVQKLLLVGF